MLPACYDTENCEVYCPNCAPDIEPEAMGQETDSPLHCGNCHTLLEHSLTGEGVRYVIDTLLDAIRTKQATDIEREWADMLRWYYLTPKQTAVLSRFSTLFPNAL